MPTGAATTKNTLLLFMKALRQLDREHLTYAAVIEILKLRFDIGDEVDQMIEVARGSDVIEQLLQEKYDRPTETILAAIDEADLRKQLQSLLEKWVPKGPPD